jgi:hypothetical protein
VWPEPFALYSASGHGSSFDFAPSPSVYWTCQFTRFRLPGWLAQSASTGPAKKSGLGIRNVRYPLDLGIKEARQ